MNPIAPCPKGNLTAIAQKLGAVSAWEDSKTGLVQVLLQGSSFNTEGCLACLADKNGNRLTPADFDYLSNSSDGLFKVHVPGGKFGYVGTTGRFVIEPIYDWTQEFSEGRAWVIRDGRRLIIDKSGNELVPESLPDGNYIEVCPFQHGRARFSLFDFRNEFGFKSSVLAFFHDDDRNAGIWGYVDTEGKVVVPPQYIFAEDFCGGLAIVCKGEWKVWNEKRYPERLWSDRMDWGGIDRDGREVLPCKFQKIKWRPFDNTHEWQWNAEITKRYLAAQNENDLWGIVDFHGRWVVEPQFGDMCYEDQTSPDGDKFVFYTRDIWGGGNPDETPCGVYSISLQRIVLPAEFVEIEFVDNDRVKVRETLESPERMIQLFGQ